jgi:DNA-binding transcriptional LysR family regulator
MNYTNIRNVDLNLLVAFDALMEERNVTRAARRLFLSQPAMSHAIDRLQSAFKDELLVRTAKGYEPTHRASAIYAQLQQVLPKIESLFADGKFDPVTVTDIFRIESTDWGATVLIPQLIRILEKRAPGVEIDVVPTRIGFERLEANEVDLVLSPLTELPPPSGKASGHLRRESLMREKVVCLVRTGHPLAKQPLTLGRYLQAQHIALSPMQGTARPAVPFFSVRQPFLAQAFKGLGKDLKVRVRIPYFVSLCRIVEKTDLIATVPFHLARHLRTSKTRIIAAPKEFRGYAYEQVWHSRNDSTPVHQWIRRLIRSLAARVT